MTGTPRVGKTTVVQKVLALLKSGFGGYYTQAVHPAREHTDYRLVTIAGKERGVAHTPVIRHFQAPGVFGVKLDELEERGVEALRRALESYPLVVVDEIGRLEAHFPRIRKWIRKALDAPCVVLATLPRDTGAGEAGRFAAEVRCRPDVRLFEVTEANRSTLAEDVTDAICDLLGPPSRWVAPGSLSTAEEKHASSGEVPHGRE